MPQHRFLTLFHHFYITFRRGSCQLISDLSPMWFTTIRFVSRQENKKQRRWPTMAPNCSRGKWAGNVHFLKQSCELRLSICQTTRGHLSRVVSNSAIFAQPLNPLLVKETTSFNKENYFLERGQTGSTFPNFELARCQSEERPWLRPVLVLANEHARQNRLKNDYLAASSHSIWALNGRLRRSSVCTP